MTLLPKEKTMPKQSLFDYTIYIYGQEKIGKTTIASRFDNAIILATEPGHNALSIFKVDIDTWDKFLDVCLELAEGKHDFSTVVIDTVDNLWNLCRLHICEKHKIEHEADMPYGKGYALILNEFHRVLIKLSMLPYGLVLISHAQVKEVQTRTGPYSKIIPSLPDKPRKLILGMADIILFFDQEIGRDADGKQNIRRVIRTQPHPSYEAGDRTGRLPDVIDLDYDAFVRAFTGKPAAEAKPKSTPKTSK